MNREIKFRAWNGSEMVFDVVVGKFGAFYVNPGSDGKGLDERDAASLTPFNTKYPEGIPIMQYTGLKDRNGKDIYEGDIVQNMNGKNPAPVYFKHGCFEWHNMPLGWEIEDGDKAVPIDTHKWAVVIGNIYENPELLTP